MILEKKRFLVNIGKIALNQEGRIIIRPYTNIQNQIYSNKLYRFFFFNFNLLPQRIMQTFYSQGDDHPE